MIKPYKKIHSKISFEDFIEKFDLSNDKCILLSSLSSSFRNAFSLSIDDKDKFYVMISKLKLQ